MSGDNVTADSERRNVAKTEVIKAYPGPYTTVGEYADALRVWMLQVYNFYCISANFPYFLAYLQSQGLTGGVNSNNSSSGTPAPPPVQSRPPANQREQTPLPRRGTEHYIPPLWKRITAEIIDFLLLFIVKLAVTCTVIDAFDLLSEFERYDFDNIGLEVLSDYNKALSILILECIHRIGTCIFEALCLHRGRQGVGGATPGKKVMGLKVVRCEWVAPTHPNQALIFPATDLGFARAVVRSVVKNFSLTFLFPVFFTFFSSQHNRTIYDVIAGSVVVEDRPHRRNN